MRTVPGGLSLAASLADGCVGSTAGDDAARQDAGLAGAPWLLVGMDGEEIPPEPRVTLEIDGARVGGWGGCNASRWPATSSGSRRRAK